MDKFDDWGRASEDELFEDCSKAEREAVEQTYGIIKPNLIRADLYVNGRHRIDMGNFYAGIKRSEWDKMLSTYSDMDSHKCINKTMDLYHHISRKYDEHGTVKKRRRIMKSKDKSKDK